MLLLTLTVLAVLSGGYVVGGLQAYAHLQKDSLADSEHCGGQSPVRICVKAPPAVFSAFYPSDVATQAPLFTVTYSSSTPVSLVVSVGVVNFTQSSSQTVNATSTTQTLSFVPPLLSRQVLRNLTSEQNTSLQVQVTDTHKHLYYLNDIPLLLHSRWLMQWVATNRLLIGAWVTPNDPSVRALVLKAATHLSMEPPNAPTAMIGYTGATRQQVMAQVNAIYDALRLDYHIRYVQASIPYSGPGSSAVATQEIKLPFEVLQQRSGMCIELTTLMASAVESIGLHAEIVIVPGHAFLGVATTPGGSHVEYWDAVKVNDGVAADSDNIYTDNEYAQNAKMHTIVDTISLSDASSAHIGAML
ncbi:MAG TPA: transglutaminase-like domain-containing protein [Ktedonobacteraceae bacterium]|nr:transglutaminase-like domain-containing protein [Ktedonobacteraceae bacterium]